MARGPAETRDHRGADPKLIACEAAWRHPDLSLTSQSGLALKISKALATVSVGNE
jgi:hypothetical protein